MSDLARFPIGEFKRPEVIESSHIQDWIRTIEDFPQVLRKEVEHLSDDQLDSTYRDGGWTIRQVVHHCADSHMNSIIRFKLTLTEDVPDIKPYREDKWAELVDSQSFPIDSSLKILEGVHGRWSWLLKSLTVDDLKREYFHPEHQAKFTLEEAIGTYAWHCSHHLAHITELKNRNGWK